MTRVSRTIRIRGRTMRRLALKAEPLTDTPNSVLRRLLGLDPLRRRRTRGVPPARDAFGRWVSCRVDAAVYRRLRAMGGTFDEAVRRLLSPGGRERR